jgi:catechol 2,3-dioxygenase-like lactoylglutathione lyase family enzyme
MFPGRFTLCLNARNLPAMRRFYEALGMVVHIDEPTSVVLHNGDAGLALMTILDEPCLNFRGADPANVQEAMTGKGLALAGTPARYEKAQYRTKTGGNNWSTTDPDGNNVFFDTNDGEVGTEGAALALQQVLDATSKQLSNVAAPGPDRDAFARVVDKFMPTALRKTTRYGLLSPPSTKPGAFAGSFTLCLKTSDTARAREFYEAMGLAVTGNNDENWVQMGNGDCQLALMSFLEENWLNFRGVDPSRIQRQLSDAGLTPEGDPARYTEEEFGVPGAHWQTKDPDGNVVYFDTSDPELIVDGAPPAVRAVLERALRQLSDIRADDACIDAIRVDVLSRFSE